MNKNDAYSFLGFDTEPSGSELNQRHKQLTAFFLSHESGSIAPLATKLNDKVNSAAELLKAAPEQKSAFDEKQKHSESSSAANKPSNEPSGKKSTSFLFPNPVESAGAMFSASWWKVYQRATLLGLAVIGAGFLIVPRMIPNIDPEPPSNVRNYEKLEPDNPKSNIYEPIGSGTVEAPPDLTSELKKQLNPEPNPNPLTIKPTQTPRAFIFSLLWALQSGADLKNFVIQPMDPSVVELLAKTHQSVSYSQLPVDAVQVLSEGDGEAVVRVNERHFTGDNVLNDYYLKSDNGTWKLSEIKEAAN